MRVFWMLPPVTSGEPANLRRSSMQTLQQSVPVPDAISGADCHVETWLTMPTERPSTLQILVSGSTYSHLYWDWPTAPEYSYVRWMAEHGYATLNLDRLGIGISSHPPGEQVTVEAHAAAV